MRLLALVLSLWVGGSVMLGLFLGRAAKFLRGPKYPPLPSGSIDRDRQCQ